MTATLALADRLARLERAVASLQQQQPDSEALQPTYINLTPAGQVAALFIGGVQIPPSSILGTAPAGNAVSWTRSDDGVMIAEVAGISQGVGGGQYLELISQATTAADSSEVDAIAYDDAGTEQARLGVSQTARGTNASVYARLLQHGLTRRVIQQDGSSDFLQLLSAQQLQLAFGNPQITAASGAFFSIAHGLGRTPQVVLAMPAGWTGSLTAGSPNATNISLAASVALAGSFIFWLAIG